MHYKEYAPSVHLKPFIEKIWTLESDDSDIYPMEHLLTPNGTEGLIFTYRQVAQKFILHNKLTVLPEVYLLIQPYEPWKVITEGCSGILGVFFRAGSLYTTLKSCINNIVGQVIELQSFLGSRPVRILREKLVEALPSERIAIVESFFSKYFCSPSYFGNTTRSAVQVIRQHKGRISIEQIASKLGMSRQAIARQFAIKVGISPKDYCRIVHFNSVQHFLKNHPYASWLDITYKFNYFDQSHLIRDFYHFTGFSPKGYAALDPFLISNFALPEVDKTFF